MGTLLVLLRGINVGGRNKIPMADLRDVFADMGFSEPTTYIQSGNVVMGSRRANGPRIVTAIERALSAAFGYEARVVVRDLPQMRTVVRQIPEAWDVEDASMRYNVIFTTHGLTAKQLVAQVTPKPAVEEVHAGSQALYWSAPFATLSKTAMIKLSAHPAYSELTVRNLRTTLTLLDLMRERG
ncbi:MAG: DUF1697 domain-containing protein [Actinomycetota bacterium]|nr:DUF1697 domain-containing protein [Actinomycetota bacterium]